MGIKQYRAVTTKIPLPHDQGEFEVRGLGLDDFSVLLNSNLDGITRAAESYANFRKRSGEVASLQAFTLIVIREFPALMMEVISIAADEPDAAATRLPLGTQVAALTEISRLTLVDAGGLGNLLTMLGSVLQGEDVSGPLASLVAALSKGSIGESAKT